MTYLLGYLLLETKESKKWYFFGWRRYAFSVASVASLAVRLVASILGGGDKHFELLQLLQWQLVASTVPQATWAPRPHFFKFRRFRRPMKILYLFWTFLGYGSLHILDLYLDCSGQPRGEHNIRSIFFNEWRTSAKCDATSFLYSYCMYFLWKERLFFIGTQLLWNLCRKDT